jgi:hypothetical protein
MPVDIKASANQGRVHPPVHLTNSTHMCDNILVGLVPVRTPKQSINATHVAMQLIFLRHPDNRGAHRTKVTALSAPPPQGLLLQTSSFFTMRTVHWYTIQLPSTCYIPLIGRDCTGCSEKQGF